jgi:tetratricopeptide (TPR) repeat protein
MGRAAVLLAIVVALGVVSAAAADDPLARLGKAHFPISCSQAAQKEFDRAVALLHSFFYPAAVKQFTVVAETDPACAMAYWGTAMALWHPLWNPPNDAGLKKGAAAVEKAKSLAIKTPRERAYVAAIERFYHDAGKVDHQTRARAYEKAMADVTRTYADDREAALFYALALQATANPTDKTYANQLKSAAILEPIFAEQPDHPGPAHYLIHAYDYPSLAQRGLAAARRYDKIAPSVPHALHMPSHTFTQLGLWTESIKSNRASEAAARELGDSGPQFHAIDYQIYAYLQVAQDGEAKRAMQRLGEIKNSDSDRNQMHYSLGAAAARYAVERKRWAEAAALEPRSSPFPYTEANTQFARALGKVRTGDLAGARKDIQRLSAIQGTLLEQKIAYWATAVEVQRRAASARLTLAEGQPEEALRLMRSAADLEDTIDKNPVTPAWLVPARELLGELLLELKQPAPALREFETSLKNEPNRFNGLYGAARAAELAGDRDRARSFYGKLLALADHADSDRAEIRQAKAFVGK